MAMRFRGRRRPKKLFSRNVARVRRTWVESLVIDPCAPLEVPWCEQTDGCCTTKWKLVLLDNQAMRDQFSDRVSVVRILGDLWVNIDPRLELTTGYFDVYDRLSQSQADIFCGLKLGEESSQSDTLTTDIWNPAFQDLSESQFKKTWQHRWNPLDQFEVVTQSNPIAVNFNLNIPVSRPDVHTFIVPGTTACNPMATGTGDICIETTQDTDCYECPQSIPPGAITQGSQNMRAARPWHIHFDVKKRIPMRENQELYLMFNARSFFNAGAAPYLFNFLMNGNLRTLVSMG